MKTSSDMITCKDYQEKVSADPGFAGDGAHLANCDACQAYRAEMQALDARILRALSVSVPRLNMPDLPDIETGNVSQLPRRGLRAPAWLAIAASVTVAVALGLRLAGNDVPVATPTLAQQVVAHFEHEQFAMQVTDQSVSDDRVARVVPANLVAMDPTVGLITYAQSCVINGKQVPHLVVQGEHGPVTILLMPGEHIDAPEKIQSGDFSGAIFPVGDGSIAIVGTAGEDLERMQERVTSSVKWQT